MKSKFDVVICTYNSEHSIKECISSILKYFSKLNKIYIVDGGSSDRTIELINEFKDIRIIVESKPNLTLGQSRAYSFSLPKTEYFLQIDSDIVIYPDFEEVFLKSFENADVVEFGVKNWYSFDTPTDDDFNNGKHNKRAFFFINSMKRDRVQNYDLPVKNMEEELLRLLLIKDGGTWLKTNTILGDHYSKPVRYQNRQITTILRIKSLPNFVFEDMGFIDKISEKKNKKLLYSLIYMVYLSLNLGLLISWFKSVGFLPKNIFYYLKGYFKIHKKVNY